MTTDDKEIVAAMRRHPELGFRLLMAKYKRPIYWHIRRLVVVHADAEDVAQETFVRVFRSFSQYRNECSFAAWIYRIATNESLRLLRRNKHDSCSLDDATPELNAALAGEYVDYGDLEAVRLQQAILSLPGKQRITFNLRYYDEMEYDEIAAVIGSTAAAAKANYHVAKEKIVQYMHTND